MIPRHFNTLSFQFSKIFKKNRIIFFPVQNPSRSGVPIPMLIREHWQLLHMVWLLQHPGEKGWKKIVQPAGQGVGVWEKKWLLTVLLYGFRLRQKHEKIEAHNFWLNFLKQSRARGRCFCQPISYYLKYGGSYQINSWSSALEVCVVWYRRLSIN